MNRGTTQKIVILALVAIIAGGLIYFIYRTFQSYFSGPSITIAEPKNYAAFSTSTATIIGTAERIQDITLDGRSITIDSKGNFSETILLMPGYNIETISAHDRFGHITQKRLELVYMTPQTASDWAEAASTTATTTLVK